MQKGAVRQRDSCTSPDTSADTSFFAGSAAVKLQIMKSVLVNPITKDRIMRQLAADRPQQTQGSAVNTSNAIDSHDPASTVVLVDTPNILRSARDRFGLTARPDYGQFNHALRRASRPVVRAEAFVNDGVSVAFAEYLQRLRFAVVYSHAVDCDEMLISRGVTLHKHAEVFVICSGDGKYASLAEMLRSLGRRVVVSAIPGSISRQLVAVADAVVNFPVSLQAAPVSASAAPARS